MDNARMKELALALRDFFAARTGEEMVRAHEALVRLAACDKAAAGELPGPLGEEEALTLEYAFNRLFVGPGPVAAPPCASVYLDGSHLHMGPATMDMRALLESLGLQVPAPGVVPDDFLPYELEACACLLDLLDNGKTAAPAGEALDWLVHEHMGTWLPLFLARAREASPPRAMNVVLDMLDNWHAAGEQKEFV